VVRVEDTESDLYGAIDLVSDKLKRKLSKIKEKAVQRSTWPGKGGPKGGPAIEDFLPAEESDSEDFAAAAPPLGEREPELPQELIREKVLMMQSATSMEAALEEMENVGHDFYIFLDEKDGAMKVVYRRKSYGYGIIIPQKV
jgi:putative sigma-54 modulation protein